MSKKTRFELRISEDLLLDLKLKGVHSNKPTSEVIVDHILSSIALSYLDSQNDFKLQKLDIYKLAIQELGDKYK